jgi:hypothetical protein
MVLFGHQHEGVRIVPLGAGHHDGVVGGAQAPVGPVQLVARRAAAAETEIAQHLIVERFAEPPVAEREAV